MQREIEALLQAWNREQDQANRMFEGLLSALSAHAAARKRMLDSVAAVAAEANNTSSFASAAAPQPELLASAVNRLRENRATLPHAH